MSKNMQNTCMMDTWCKALKGRQGPQEQSMREVEQMGRRRGEGRGGMGRRIKGRKKKGRRRKRKGGEMKSLEVCKHGNLEWNTFIHLPEKDILNTSLWPRHYFPSITAHRALCEAA